jgi:hypothetical protein
MLDSGSTNHMTGDTIGNMSSFVSTNIFVGTDEFNSIYICRYPKLTNTC